MFADSRLRLYLVTLFLTAGFGLLLYRLWVVQITQHEEYLHKVPGTRHVTVRVPGVRGEILDRRGEVLARNRFNFEIVLNLKDIEDDYRRRNPDEDPPVFARDVVSKGIPTRIEEVDIDRIVRETVFNPLVEMGLNVSYSSRDLRVHYRSTYGVVPYAFYSDLSFPEYCVLAERSLDIAGVEIGAPPVREYPLGALASHTLGYVSGPDETRELGKLEKLARGNGPEADQARQTLDRYTFFVADPFGLLGVERTMDAHLRGKPGMRTLLRNEHNVIVRETDFIPPQPGADVYLTLDARVQMIVERALRGVGVGAAVVLDPNSGDILAMASVPSFDPNNFIPRITQEKWNAYEGDVTRPFLNRAIKTFAPGSTFKIIIAIAGSLAGVHTHSFHCAGRIKYDGRFRRCWIFKRGGAHGSLGLRRALQFSCNCFFYQYANRAGIDRILEASKLFGLGSETGLPLPGEAGGLVPGPEWLKRVNPRDAWSRSRTALVAIGQAEVSASPLQMANVAATIANGGICYRPRIISRIAEKDGTVVEDIKPEVRYNLLHEGVSASAIQQVRKGMHAVVNGLGGTARRAAIEGVEVAGKTGTAEFKRNGQMEKHAWFIAFAPYEEPEIAVCVFVYLGKGGGVVAAPIAREIIARTLAEDASDSIPLFAITEAKGSFTMLEEVKFDEPFFRHGEDFAAEPDFDGEPGAFEVLDPDDFSTDDGERETEPEMETPSIRQEPDVVPQNIRTSQRRCPGTGPVVAWSVKNFPAQPPGRISGPSGNPGNFIPYWRRSSC